MTTYYFIAWKDNESPATCPQIYNDLTRETPLAWLSHKVSTSRFVRIVFWHEVTLIEQEYTAYRNLLDGDAV